MKKHYTGKANDLINPWGEKIKGFSIYKNPNPELKEQIKNFKPDTTKVTLGWPDDKIWNIIEWEDQEVKCQNGRSTNYFKRKEVEEALKEQSELERNEKFPAYKHFKDCFGIVSKLEKDNEYGWNLSVLELSDKMVIGHGNFNPISVEHYKFTYEGELKFGHDYSLELTKYCDNMCLYFNKEGDFVNRDYNLDLNYYKCKEVSLRILLDEFKNRILSLGEIGCFRDKYYIGKTKLTPFIQREDSDIYNKLSFGFDACEVKAFPKKMEFKAAEEIWNEIYKLIPEDAFEIFKMNNVETAIEA